jgi:hypothetical protein
LNAPKAFILTLPDPWSTLAGFPEFALAFCNPPWSDFHTEFVTSLGGSYSNIGDSADIWKVFVVMLGVVGGERSA